MYLFFNLIYIGVFISIPIIIVLLLKNKLLKRYSCKFNSFLCGLIFFRLIFLIKFRIEMQIDDFSKGGFKFNIFINENSGLYKNSCLSQFLMDQIYLNEYIYILFKLFMFVWLFVLIYLIVKMIKYNVDLYKYLYRYSEEICDEDIIEILNQNKNQLKIKKNVEIYTIENLNSAMLTTFGKNKIFLPDVVYDKDELNLVIKHELIHLKKKDNIKKLLVNILTCIYWFNPLVKRLNLYFEELCELSNDQKIIEKASNKEKKKYANLLLKTKNEQLKKYTIYLNGSFFSKGKKSNLRNRIEEVLSKVLKNDYYIIIPLLIVLFFSSICNIYDPDNSGSSIYSYLDSYISLLEFKEYLSSEDVSIDNPDRYYSQSDQEYENFFKNKKGKIYGRCIQLQDGEKDYPDLIEVVFDENKKIYVINEWPYNKKNSRKKGYIKKEEYLKIKQKTENYNYGEIVQTQKNTINVYDKNGEKIIGKYNNI